MGSEKCELNAVKLTFICVAGQEGELAFDPVRDQAREDSEQRGCRSLLVSLPVGVDFENSLNES